MTNHDPRERQRRTRVWATSASQEVYVLELLTLFCVLALPGLLGHASVGAYPRVRRRMHREREF